MGKINFSTEEKILTQLFEDFHIEYFATLSPESTVVSLPRLMPENTESIVLFLIPYYVPDESPVRNVARFAVSRDYHLFGEMLSKELAMRFADAGSAHKVCVMCDHSPLDEKKCAVNAGLATWGQNRLVINGKYGSYFFIGAVFTSAKANIKSDTTTVSDSFRHCTDCGACKKACPTLLSDGSECMSALTQKKRLCDKEQAIIRESSCKWGCDICQDVCPANTAPITTPVEFFHKARIPHVTKELVASMSDEVFSQRSYGWRGRQTILRNLSSKKDV